MLRVLFHNCSVCRLDVSALPSISTQCPVQLHAHVLTDCYVTLSHLSHMAGTLKLAPEKMKIKYEYMQRQLMDDR